MAHGEPWGMNSHVHDTAEDDIEMDMVAIGSNQDDNQSEFSNSSEAATGDIVFANSIIHMQDAMLHYKFTHAIASGNIGQALEVMNVSGITPR
jgi:Family of unknown function (DUF6589)